MIHDETTTKLELPNTQSNVVRVQFGAQDAKATKDSKTAPILSNDYYKRSTLIPSLDEINLSSPWVLRLLAVIAILGLSLLML